MTAALVQDVPRARIETALAVSPLHMRPILLAVRDHGIAWATIPQHAGRFEIPTGKSFVAILGDDLHVAMGPDGFHRESVRAVLARSSFVSIVAAEPLPLAYAAPASAAVGLRLNGTIIETRPEFELRWLDIVKAEAPRAQIILVSVKERGH